MDQTFIPVNIALLTISDTRNVEDGTTGKVLRELANEAEHHIVAQEIVPDDKYQIRSIVSQWIADKNVQAIISTGGTGLTGRDGTPEAMKPLFDKEIEGVGELFRWISYQEIGTSTIASRCVGGLANGTFIFCLPGSTGACRTGWDKVIAPQLDCNTRPCNIVALMPRLLEK